MKIKKNFGRIVISLMVSIIIFIGLLVIQQTILNPNGTSKVFIANEDIKEKTIITNENVEKLFKEKKVDGELKVTNAVTSKKELINKLINKEIEKGAVVSNNTLIDKNSILSIIKDPIEVSIKVNDISQVVGGTLRAGDTINISIVNDITKGNERILENVYINKVFSNEGKEVKKEDIVSALTINIIIPKEDEEKLNKSLVLGIIRVSRIN